MSLEEKIGEALAEFPPGRRYLAGVSGGRDSVTLLHLLHRIGYGNLIVCHLNHRLRGAAATEDARFVARLCKKLGLEFVRGSAEVMRLSLERQQSLETAAREARYDFFAKVARAKKCRTILLGHHADDRVETFLFNLFRGSGVTGLRAIQPKVTRTIHGVKLQVVRPMLSIWREEIDAYVSQNKLLFREDVSNKDLSKTRNRLRHVVTPMLEREFGRDVRRAIWRAAEILAAEDDYVGAAVPRSRAELSVPDLRNMPVALQRRLIQQWLRISRVPDAGFREIEAVRSLISDTSKSKVNLPGDRHARRREKRIFLA